jgi:DNA-binding transcriptional regulator YdaS (Cro superfamily)
MSSMRKQMLKAIALAVEREGSLTRVAERLGIRRQAIREWDEIRRNKTKPSLRAVPAKHVLALEEMSGVSRYELRPDIYGPAPKSTQRQETVAAA